MPTMREVRRKITNFAVTGPRQVGKSTAVAEVLRRLKDIRVARFITRPLVEDNRHVGYALVTPDGSEHVFARADWPGPQRRGRWGFDPSVFDGVSTQLLAALGTVDLLVFDEIGFMEDGAPRFESALTRWLDSNSPTLLVLKEGPRGKLVTRLLERSDLQLWRLPDVPARSLIRELVARIQLLVRASSG